MEVLKITKQTKAVVFNCDVPSLLENRLFDPQEAVKVSHTILPICHLNREAKKRGIVCMTSDVYLSAPEKPRVALLYCHLSTSDAHEAMNAGAKPCILTCEESPFVATRFYAGLPLMSNKFSYSIVFSGMKRWLSPRTEYRTMYFPQPYPSMLPQVPFGQKKFLVMASSAKGIRSKIKTLLLKLMYGWNVQEINRERYRAITVFSENPGFDLYGYYWDKEPRVAPRVLNKCYRGPLPFAKKAEVFNQYKFSLCFENSVFPGYVTEKIFDSMAAGCVPVYLGAPDITEFVPEGAFIDVRNFSSYEELGRFLENMKAEEYRQYTANISEFFTSDAYRKYTQEYYAEQVLSILEQEFARHA